MRITFSLLRDSFVFSVLHFSITIKSDDSPCNSIAAMKAGVVLGVSISIGFIMICLCSIYCRRKYENSRSFRNDAQPTNGRVLSRNGNGCCVEQSSASASQQVNAIGGAPNEIELAVLCPSSPIETNPHSDAKVIELLRELGSSILIF